MKAEKVLNQLQYHIKMVRSLLSQFDAEVGRLTAESEDLPDTISCKKCGLEFLKGGLDKNFLCVNCKVGMM